MPTIDNASIHETTVAGRPVGVVGSEQSGALPPPRRRRRRIRAAAGSTVMYRRRIVPLLVGPAVLFEILVYALPIVAGIYTSLIRVGFSTLHDWFGAPYVGLDNYRLIGRTSAIYKPLIHSFLLSVEYTACVVVLSLLLGFTAVVMVRSIRRGGRLFNVVFLLPFGIPAYAGALTWQFIFQSHGMANSLLGTLQLPGGDALWLTGQHAFWAMVLATTWRTWPFVFLMLMAATQSISVEVVEALRIDGGSRWDEVRHITYPHVRSTVVTVSLILFLWTFNDFTTPYVLFGQIPPPSADLFPLHVYSNSFANATYSIGAAMTVMAVIVLLLFGLPFSRLSGLWGKNDA